MGGGGGGLGGRDGVVVRTLTSQIIKSSSYLHTPLSLSHFDITIHYLNAYAWPHGSYLLNKCTHLKRSVSCFAPCSEDSNDCSFSVALAIFLTQSCPVVPSDAVTISIYSGKLSLAKTGALDATAPKKQVYK